MKWARVRAKSNETNPKSKDAEQDKKNDEACFVYYPDQKTLEKELEQSKNEWAFYEFSFRFRKPELTNFENFQKRYELYCGGYLMFYDRVVRNWAVDHILHFKWNTEKGPDKYSVRIFITPPPQKPLKRVAQKSGKVDDKNFKKIPVGGVYQDMTTAPPDEGGYSVDPPPPPPPPPPTMH